MVTEGALVAEGALHGSRGIMVTEGALAGKQREHW